VKSETILDALDLPPGSRVDKKVPKRLLIENIAESSSDRRTINEGVWELLWVAALKPSTIGVPEYRDDLREYVEIALLHLAVHQEARLDRLVELVHRAVPYPVLLVTEKVASAGLSAAHKRWAQNEAGKTVLDGEVIAVYCDGTSNDAYLADFYSALSLGRQPRTTIYSLYQGWINTILTLKAAEVTGIFRPSDDHAHAMARQEALGDCSRLENEIARLRKAASKEKQIARQIELNMELKAAKAALDAARSKL